MGLTWTGVAAPAARKTSSVHSLLQVDHLRPSGSGSFQDSHSSHLLFESSKIKTKVEKDNKSQRRRRRLIMIDHFDRQCQMGTLSDSEL